MVKTPIAVTRFLNQAMKAKWTVSRQQSRGWRRRGWIRGSNQHMR